MRHFAFMGRMLANVAMAVSALTPQTLFGPAGASSREGYMGLPPEPVLQIFNGRQRYYTPRTRSPGCRAHRRWKRARATGRMDRRA